MKRIAILTAVLLLIAAVFTGCGRTADKNETNASTTDDGVVNGTNDGIVEEMLPDDSSDKPATTKPDDNTVDREDAQSSPEDTGTAAADSTPSDSAAPNSDDTASGARRGGTGTSLN